MTLRKSAIIGVLVATMLLASCAGGPLTRREIGVGVGALGGAAAGGIIGGAGGHPGAGAAIGGALRLGAGGVGGDQLQGQSNEQERQRQEIERQRREIEELKRKQGQY